MKLKEIIGLSFTGVVAVGGVTAASVYLPQVVTGTNFYGTQLVDNQAVYSKIAKSTNSVSVFDNNNGNLGKFVGGTPNVSLDVLLNGTNSYSNGNYIVLFASDGDTLSNQFLYGDSYKFNANNDQTVNFNKFGFTINKNNVVEFNKNNVVANFANGNIQKAFQFLTDNKANSSLQIMAELPSIVLVHDKISYEAMESLISYVDYVNSCFNDVQINLDGSYTFKVGSENYKKFREKNPNVGNEDAHHNWNFKMATSLELFQKLVGFDSTKKPEDQTSEDEKLSKQAQDMETEYKWAADLDEKYNDYYGFQFNPVNSSFEVNTYSDPFGNAKPYRTDIGAKKYVESFSTFKQKLSPSYVNAAFENQPNIGHFIGFAHTSISQDSVLLSDSYANIPNDPSGNQSSNLSEFAGKSSNSKFTANIISLYNSITNANFKGKTLLRFQSKNTKTINVESKWLPTPEKKLLSLNTWYTTK